MKRQATFIGYDIFKLIVALILLIILILPLLRTPQPAATQAALPGTSTQSSIPLAGPTEAAILLPGATAQPTGTPVSPQASPTQEPAAALAAASTPEPSPTPTPEILPTATPPVEATPTTAAAATETPAPATAQAASDCPLAMPTRLKVGDTARVLSNVQMRSAPEISNNIILSNPTGTQFQIIGGPVCGPYQGGAYVWWQVQRSDGKIGWSAEGALNGGSYFLEPLR